MLQVEQDDLEDVRLAVVMNGGVSLAVWIGGTAREINRLSSGQDSFYRELAQLTGSTVRTDVMAGTSAGGINAPALALAEIFGRDLSSLGQLWISAGGFTDLLRDPFDKVSPSLLKGDAYLLPQILNAYRQLRPDADDPERATRPVDLIVTGSLWHAERVPFQDSYGSQIIESVHEALFRFRRPDAGFGVDDPDVDQAGGPAGDPNAAHGALAAPTDDFSHPQIVDQLALAARSTSANQFGFEASWVPMNQATPLHPVMKGVFQLLGGAPVGLDHFVLDGGIIINMPVRPALDAIDAYPAERQVRRILVYVEPDPGNPIIDNVADDPACPPSFFGVLMAAEGSLPKTQTIAAELGEIRDHNARAKAGRAERAEQLAAFDDLGNDAVLAMAEALLPAYRRVRARQLGEHLAELWGRLPGPSATPATSWTPEEIAAVFLSGAGTGRFDDAFAVSTSGRMGLDPDPAAWGLPVLDALASAVLDVSRRAMWLAPIDHPERRARLRDLRRGVHQCRQRLLRLHAADDGFWQDRLRQLPAPPPDPAGRATELGKWAAVLDRPWLSPVGRDACGRVAARLVQLVLDHQGDVLAAATADPMHPWRVADAQTEADTLRRLMGSLADQVRPLVPPAGPTGDQVRPLVPPAARPWLPAPFLGLEVCRQALGQGDADPGLELALMQVSAYTPNTFGLPAGPSKLAGYQLQSFGGFYKQSWRANDWTWGRLDGAYRMVQAMLDPARLTQLGYTRAELYDRLRRLATTGDLAADRAYLAAQWDARAQAIQAELGALGGSTTPAGLVATASAVAGRAQLGILRQELPLLALAAEADRAAGARSGDRSDAFAVAYRQAEKAGQLDGARVVSLWQGAGISQETFKTELGSDLLASTASTVVAVAVNTLASGQSGLGPLRAVAKVVRGVTLVLYLMIRSSIGGGFGAAITNLALAIGGALLAVSVTVGGVPPVLPLVGGTVMAAGLAMAALRTTKKAFLAIFAVITVLGVLAFVVSEAVHWFKTPSSTWWTLAAVVVFAGGAMVLGSIHDRAPKAVKGAKP